MKNYIDSTIGNLSDCKLWDIVRLSAIVSTDRVFLQQVEQEISHRQGEARALRRCLFSSALVDQYGRETAITEAMIDRACNTSPCPGNPPPATRLISAATLNLPQPVFIRASPSHV
jgi:hypothetical protein